jgi:hypothetical protein
MLTAVLKTSTLEERAVCLEEDHECADEQGMQAVAE